METMYDRLGDLLSETLEAGHVKFVHLEEENAEAPAGDTKRGNSGNEFNQENVSENKKNTNHEQNKQESLGSQEKQDRSSNSTRTTKPARKIKKITPEIQRAYRLFGISVSATVDDVKKAYKEKLKYYHPDRYQHNPILAKIATDKTRQVVEAYSLLLDFLK